MRRHTLRLFGIVLIIIAMLIAVINDEFDVSDSLWVGSALFAGLLIGLGIHMIFSDVFEKK